MNGRPGGAQHEAENYSDHNQHHVVDVRRKRRDQGEQTGPEHGMSENASSADQLGQTTARQFGKDIAPEEASQHKVPLVRVPREALLDHFHSVRGQGRRVAGGVGGQWQCQIPRQSDVLGISLILHHHVHDGDGQVDSQGVVQHEAEHGQQAEHLAT